MAGHHNNDLFYRFFQRISSIYVISKSQVSMSSETEKIGSSCSLDYRCKFLSWRHNSD